MNFLMYTQNLNKVFHSYTYVVHASYVQYNDVTG